MQTVAKSMVAAFLWMLSEAEQSRTGSLGDLAVVLDLLVLAAKNRTPLPLDALVGLLTLAGVTETVVTETETEIGAVAEIVTVDVAAEIVETVAASTEIRIEDADALDLEAESVIAGVVLVTVKASRTQSRQSTISSRQCQA